MNRKHRAMVLVLVLAVLSALTALPVLAQEAPIDPPACPFTEGIVINAQGGTWDVGMIRSDRNRADGYCGTGSGGRAGRHVQRRTGRVGPSWAGP